MAKEAEKPKQGFNSPTARWIINSAQILFYACSQDLGGDELPHGMGLPDPLSSVFDHIPDH